MHTRIDCVDLLWLLNSNGHAWLRTSVVERMNTAPVALVVLGLAFVAAMSAKSDGVGGGGGINGGGV